MLFYWFVRAKIFILSAILPLSIAVLLTAYWTFSLAVDRDNTTTIPATFIAIALAEFLFCLLYYYKRSHLDAFSPYNPDLFVLSKADRMALFYLCANNVANPKEYFSGWFHHAPYEQIKRGDISRFLAWAFYGERVENLNAEDAAEIGEMIDFIADKFKVTFELGDSHLPCIRLNFDPVIPKYRPLGYYILLFVAGRVANAMFYLMGFRKHFSVHHPIRGLISGNDSNGSYVLNHWVRNPDMSPDSKQDTTEPLIFFHGIGVGIVAYIAFFRKLSTMPEGRKRPIVLVEIPMVSSTFFPLYSSMLHRVPTPREFVDDLNAIVNSLGHKKATFVGHSLGSTVLSWCIRMRPEMVSRAVFLDPVCFLLHHPDVAYNFIHRTPTDGPQLFLHFFAATELYIRWFLHRCFIWHENVLFLEDIPDDIKVDVILAEVDCIVPASRVAAYLRERVHGLYALKGFNHAEFLLSGSAERFVRDVLLERSLDGVDKYYDHVIDFHAENSTRENDVVKRVRYSTRDSGYYSSAVN
eukprot:Partr_v1_DN26241_c0_g1_i1_m48694 putative NA